jgi:hypothetical protein
MFILYMLGSIKKKKTPYPRIQTEGGHYPLPRSVFPRIMTWHHPEDGKFNKTVFYSIDDCK